MGYTHIITLERRSSTCRLWLPVSFRTTRDAVRLHLRALRIQRSAGSVRAIGVSQI